MRISQSERPGTICQVGATTQARIQAKRRCRAVVSPVGDSLPLRASERTFSGRAGLSRDGIARYKKTDWSTVKGIEVTPGDLKHRKNRLFTDCILRQAGSLCCIKPDGRGASIRVNSA